MILSALTIFGLVIGSFINVLVLRLRTGESIMGRSCCPNCHTQLAWYHNIPLLSFIVLRAKCAFCAKSISWQYPLVELSAAGLFVLGKLPYARGGILELIIYLLLAVALLVLWVYDYKYMQLPDIITLPSIIIIGVLNIWRGVPAQNLFLAAAITGGFFAAQFLLSRGRWVGSGDMRLGVLTGVSLGFPLCLVALVLAYMAGAIIGVALILIKKKTLKSQIPFGVFLTTTTVLIFLWGAEILAWYWNLFL